MGIKTLGSYCVESQVKAGGEIKDAGEPLGAEWKTKTKQEESFKENHLEYLEMRSLESCAQVWDFEPDSLIFFH